MWNGGMDNMFMLFFVFFNYYFKDGCDVDILESKVVKWKLHFHSLKLFTSWQVIKRLFMFEKYKHMFFTQHRYFAYRI